MILSDRFVYVHMPKTGGTFVEAALARLLGGGADRSYLDTSTREGQRALGARDQHQTVSEIPAEYRDLPILFTARNPFDHYVSFFSFAWWKTHPGDTFDESRIRATHPHYPELTFAEYLEAVYDWQLLDRGYISDEIARRLEAVGAGPLTYDYVRFLFHSPEDVLNDLQRYLVEGGYRDALPAVHFLRQESLSSDLLEFLLSVGYREDEIRFITDIGPVHPPGGPRRASSNWRQNYRPDLMKLVREREWFLFSLFPEYDEEAAT